MLKQSRANFSGDLPVDREMILGFAEVVVPFFLPGPSRGSVVGKLQPPGFWNSLVMGWKIDYIREVVDTNAIGPFGHNAQIGFFDNEDDSLGESLFNVALSVLEVDVESDNILGLVFHDARNSCQMVRGRDCPQNNISSPVMSLQVEILDHHFRQVVEGSSAWRVGRWGE